MSLEKIDATEFHNLPNFIPILSCHSSTLEYELRESMKVPNENSKHHHPSAGVTSILNTIIQAGVKSHVEPDHFEQTR